MIYLTSDTHFNHDREFIYGPRGFGSIGESNKALIDNWNSTIDPDDDVYMLGDFFLGEDLDFVVYTLSILNGRIHVVRGNHDTDAKMQIYKSAVNVVEISDASRLDYADMHFYLSHYPTLTSNLHDTLQTAVFNLHGHTHSNRKFYQGRPYMYNVAVDAQDNRPVSIDQVVADITAEVTTCMSFLV